MGMQTARLLPITARCAGSSVRHFCLVPRTLAQRANVLGTRMSPSARPAAQRAGCPGRCLGWNRPRTLCQLHEVRGGAGFGLVPDLKAAAPAAALYSFYLVHKEIRNVNFFVKKKKVPCCGRRIGLSLDETFNLHVNRVTPVTYGLIGMVRS